MIDGRRGQEAAPQAIGAGEDSSLDGASTAPPRSRWGGPQLGLRLHRLGVTANQVTAVGLALAGVTAYVIASGYLWQSTFLLTAGGLMDALDGAVAKAAGSSSKRGAFLDSTTDRLGDALVFGGVAWYFLAGHDPRLAMLPLAVLAVSSVVSYERAKAESLGFDAKGGLMERAERLILLGFGLVFHFLLVWVLWVLLGLTAVTALQRFVKVWKQATAELEGEAAKPVPAVVSAWRRGRVESRWRAWREASFAPAGARVMRLARPPANRWRVRRQAAPLASRLPRVLQADRLGQRAVRKNQAGRQGRVRTSSARPSAIRSFGRRLEQDR